jgi:proteasome lid subunit RPN8/RPN11
MHTFSEIQNFKTPLRELWETGNERCGIITEAGEIIEKTNISMDPEHQFEFALEDLDGAYATWHTHPKTDANLSIADYWFFKSWPSKSHFIITLTEVRCFLTAQGIVYFVDEEEDHPSWLPSGPLPSRD